MSSDGDDRLQNERRNWLNSIQVFVDQYYRPIRIGLYITGGVAFITVARNLRMISVFKKVEDIPSDFITSCLRLNGAVREVNRDGTLRIQHIPMLRLPFTKKDYESLPIHLACIDASGDGTEWLNNNVLNTNVWFYLLHRCDVNETTQLHCKVAVRKKLSWNIPVNETLVKHGLCKISSLSDLEKLNITDNRNMLRYLDRLVKLEHKANKREKGMWKKTEEEYTLARKGFNVFSSVLSSPYYAVRWIYRNIKKRKS